MDFIKSIKYNHKCNGDCDEFTETLSPELFKGLFKCNIQKSEYFSRLEKMLEFPDKYLENPFEWYDNEMLNLEINDNLESPSEDYKNICMLKNEKRKFATHMFAINSLLNKYTSEFANDKDLFKYSENLKKIIENFKCISDLYKYMPPNQRVKCVDLNLEKYETSNKTQKFEMPFIVHEAPQFENFKLLEYEINKLL